MELQIPHCVCSEVPPKACPDHIHLFVEIPPKLAVSKFMGYLKGKSTTMIFEQFPDLKYKYRNREFGAEDTMLIQWAKTKIESKSISSISSMKISLENNLVFPRHRVKRKSKS